ncbi:MAG: hypothetical protein JWQ43_4129 [Glaciihabitans sp.]|nr:hypothetical protein [Glaciihabitans sp.]
MNQNNDSPGKNVTTPEVPGEKVLSKKHTIGSFAATTVLSGGVSVLSIPVIVLLTNANDWASIALGQAVGSSIGVLAMFGWGITGPAAIAMMPHANRAAAYWESIVARIVLFVPALILTVALTWLLVPSEQLASVVCGAAMVFGGLSGSWYAVGRKRPDRLFILDTIPRVGGTLLGILLLWASGSLVLFGLAQLLGSLLAFLFVTIWALPGLHRPAGAAQGTGSILAVIAAQRHGVAVAVAIASYYPAVLAIIAAFAPAFLPLYALIEKVLRFATMALQPVFQYFQAHVPGHTGPELRREILRGLKITAGFGAICWIGFALLLPVASFVLAAGQVEVPVLVAINLGGYMGLTVVATYLSTVALIAVHRIKSVGRAALVTSVVGLSVILFLALIGDGADISWGFLVTAATLAGYQLVVLYKTIRLRNNP